MNDSKTLEDYNQAVINQRIVPIVFLGAYIVLGVLGNSLVIYVYFLRFKTFSENRFFIPSLAVIDLIACVANCSVQLSEELARYVYKSDIDCKFGRYLCLTTTLVSIFTLLIIAIDRYLKICRPFGRQLSLKWKKLSIAISLIAALILAIPVFIFNGSVESAKHGITFR